MSTSNSATGHLRETDPDQAKAEALVLEYIRSIRFGSVEITLHNARIVQVERREKLRVGQQAG